MTQKNTTKGRAADWDETVPEGGENERTGLYAKVVGVMKGTS